MELSTWFAGLSAVAAILSAVLAIRSSLAARRSSEMAERQTALAYQEFMGRWEPTVEFEVLKVVYRWSSGALVWDEGSWADPDMGVEDRITLEAAKSEGLQVEVVLTGELVNQGARPALLTAHDHDSVDVRFPLQNQRVFLFDGQATRTAILPAGEKIEMTWVDRRPVDEWREHHVAHVERNVWGDEELGPPDLSLRKRPKSLLRVLRDPWSNDYLKWKTSVLGRSAFRIVVDTRAADRIPEVWEVGLGQSPIIPAGRDEKTDALLWKTCLPEVAPIDDDVVFYRCHRSSVFAQLKPPRRRFVPGRL